MAETVQLQRVDEHGWRCGFANVLRLENQRWWATKRWWVQSLIMTVLLNGILAYGIWIVPLLEPVEPNPEFVPGTLDVILIWMSILSVFSTIFITQSAIIGEKQSGVVAWIMSGPVSRSAFIIAEFIGNAIGLLSTTVLLQGILIYLQFSMTEGYFLPIIPIMAALLLQSLYLLFYLSLVIMLGTFFSSRVPLLAISFATLIGQPFIDNFAEEFAPWLSWALPAKLPELARFAHRWQRLPSYSSIVLTLALTLGFLVLAIWRFKREEF